MFRNNLTLVDFNEFTHNFIIVCGKHFTVTSTKWCDRQEFNTKYRHHGNNMVTMVTCISRFLLRITCGNKKNSRNGLITWRQLSKDFFIQSC